LDTPSYVHHVQLQENIIILYILQFVRQQIHL